jgi:hypothetical protein
MTMHSGDHKECIGVFLLQNRLRALLRVAGELEPRRSFFGRRRCYCIAIPDESSKRVGFPPTRTVDR